MTAARPGSVGSFRYAIAIASLCGCTQHEAPATDTSSAIAQQRSVASADSLDQLVARADTLHTRGEYDSALTYWNRTLPSAVAAHDTLLQARVLTGLGLTYWRMSRYAEAARFSRQALELKERGGLREELSRSHNALGLIAFNQGRFAEAFGHYQRAISTAKATNDSVGIARAVANLGLVHTEVGEYAAAAESFELLRRVASARGDRRSEANALNNAGMVSVRAGDPARAVPLLRKALGIYREIESPAGEENALGQLGTAYQAMGDPQRALAHLDSALVIARKTQLGQQEVDNLGLLAELFSEAGDHVRALEFLKHSDSANRALDMQSEQGDIAVAQARAHAALGNVAGARERIRAARAAHASAGATIEVMRDDLFAAELTQRHKEPGEAARLLRSARSAAAELDLPVVRAELAIGEATVHELAGNHRGVLRGLQNAGRDLDIIEAERGWQVNALAARAHAALGDDRRAVERGRRAIAGIERVRARFTSGALRASYISDKSRVYLDQVLALLRLGAVDEAFQVADAARSRSLVEHIGNAGRDLRSRAPSDLARADMLLRRIDALVERLREAERKTPRERGGVAGHDDIEGRLAEARREYEMLMHNSARVDTSALRLIGAATASRREVQAALVTGELLVEYLMTSEELVVFALTRESSRVLRVPVGAADMESRIRLARDLAGQRRDAPATRRAALEWLHGSLIAPLEDGAPAVVRRLIIVPHGALAYLPFAALINAKSGHALVQEVTLQMVPSAAALTAVRHSGGAAAMPALTVLAPFPRELPGSKEEMRAIARRPRVTTVEALRATEAAARAALSAGAMVHFATHGILNVRNPMFSRLELARAASVHPGDDGRLEVHELLAFEVRSPMVFLSGCETGVGGEWSTAFRRGEDYATLAQAFLLAGARNVIATLWRIEDRGAAEFATAFYNALPASDPAEALAIAQRAMLSSERYSAPYYWAGYTLSGSGTPVAQKRQALAVQ